MRTVHFWGPTDNPHYMPCVYPAGIAGFLEPCTNLVRQGDGHATTLEGRTQHPAGLIDEGWADDGACARTNPVWLGD
jgi:hypothetical protein